MISENYKLQILNLIPESLERSGAQPTWLAMDFLSEGLLERGLYAKAEDLGLIRVYS